MSQCKVILVLFCLSNMTLWAQNDVWVFKDGNWGTSLSRRFQMQYSQIVSNPNVFASHFVQAIKGSLYQSEISIELFEGQKYLFHVTDLTETNDSYLIWRGTLRGEQYGQAAFALAPNGAMTGKIVTEQGHFRLMPLDDDIHLLSQWGLNHEFYCEQPLPSRLNYEHVDEVSFGTKRYFTLDILVVYTSQAESALPGIVSEIRLNEADARQTLDNIGGAYFSPWMKINVAGIHQVTYNESVNGNLDAAYQFLRGNSQVSSLRDLYRADVVVMIMSKLENDNGISSGNAYRVGAESYGVSKDEAFVVLNTQALRDIRPVFTHEIGHLLGGEHATAPGAKTRGFMSLKDRFIYKTVMVTDLEYDFICSGICSPVAYLNWSNPAQRIQGVNIGVEGASDNVHTTIQYAWPRMSDLWLRD